MKKLLKYLSAILILLVLAGIGAYYLAKKFEPEVRSVVVGELNKYLAVPVKVGDINLSLLQRLPYASLRFSDVVIPEIKKDGTSTDTLIYIKDMYLQIGLLDFFQKKYEVTEAEINSGYFRMKFFPDGSDNFHFWKSSSDSTGSTELSLKDVHVENFAYSLSTADNLGLSFFVEETDASGDFGKDIYDIESANKIQIKSIVNADATMYLNEYFDGDLNLNINKIADKYAFESSLVALADQEMTVKGYYAPSENQSWVVKIKSEDADLEKLAHLLPISLRKTLGVYESRGETNLDLTLSSGKDFNLDAAFSDLNGTFQHHEGLGTAKIDAAKGKIEIRNDIRSIFLDELRARIGPGKIEAWGKIIDLNAPSFDLNIKGEIDLNELKSLLNIKLLEELGGNVNVDGRLHGNLPRESANATLELLKGIDFIGKINVEDGTFKMAGQDQKFDRIDGDVQLKDNAILIKSADARVNENPFTISGKIENALPYISSPGQKLRIEANFSAEELNFNKILTSNTSTRDTTYHFQLPENISFDLSVAIGKLAFRKFEAQAVHGKAYYKSGLLTLNPVQFTTADGNVNANMRLKQKSANEFEIQSTAFLDHLNLPILFEAFENFGQSVIQAHHLEGRANAKIIFSTVFKSDLSIEMPTVASNIQLEVSNGKLKNLETLIAIGDYLRQNALWRSLIKVDDFQKKLKVVEFDTLRNEISIKNEVVNIPAMSIGSSALTLNISGTHTFDNGIDYSLNFKLSQLLRTGKKEQSEFGYIVDDNSGLRLFMKMEGTVDNPRFSMDGDAARTKRKNQFDDEKNTFKGILKEEFGLFKSDTTITATKVLKEEKDPKFSVDWDDFKNKNDSLENAKKKKGAKKKKNDDDLFKDDDM